MGVSYRIQLQIERSIKRKIANILVNILQLGGALKIRRVQVPQITWFGLLLYLVVGLRIIS